MRKRKVLAMVAGLVLSMSVAVPGTLAVEADSAGTESSSISVTSEDGTGAGTETGEGASTAAVTDFAAAAVAAVQTTASGSPESTSFEGGSGESTASDADEKTGTDAAEKTGTEVSSEASEETATDAADKTAASAGTETGAGTGAGVGTATGTETGTADGASKTAANASGASKDQNAANAPETFTHKDGCGDDCKDESCTCGCHLYRQIMACGTIDEIWEILDNADEASFTLLSEEQNAKIDARIEELEPEPAPAIVIEEATETVPSIIEYGLVSFTDVAPLGEPVTGGTD